MNDSLEIHNSSPLSQASPAMGSNSSSPSPSPTSSPSTPSSPMLIALPSPPPSTRAASSPSPNYPQTPPPSPSHSPSSPVAPAHSPHPSTSPMPIDPEAIYPLSSIPSPTPTQSSSLPLSPSPSSPIPSSPPPLNPSIVADVDAENKMEEEELVAAVPSPPIPPLERMSPTTPLPGSPISSPSLSPQISPSAPSPSTQSLQSTISQLQYELNETRERLAAAEMRVGEKDRMLIELNGQLSALHTSNSLFSSHLSMAKEDNKEIDRKYNNLCKQHSGISVSLTELRKKYTSLLGERDQNNLLLTQYKLNLEEKEGNIKMLIDQRDKEKKEKEELLTISREMQRNVEGLQAQLKGKEKKEQENTEIIEMNRIKIEQLNNEINELKEIVEANRDNAPTAPAGDDLSSSTPSYPSSLYDANEYATLSLQFQSVTERLNQLQYEDNLLREKIKYLEGEIIEKKSICMDYTNKLNDLCTSKAEIAKIQTENHYLKEKIDRLNEEIKLIISKEMSNSHNYNLKLQQSTQQYNQKNEEIILIQRQLREAQEEGKKGKEGMKALQEELGKSRMRGDKYKEMITEAQKREMEEEKVKEKIRINYKQNESKLFAQIQSLEGYINQLRDNISRLNKQREQESKPQPLPPPPPSSRPHHSPPPLSLRPSPSPSPPSVPPDNRMKEDRPPLPCVPSDQWQRKRKITDGLSDIERKISMKADIQAGKRVDIHNVLGENNIDNILNEKISYNQSINVDEEKRRVKGLIANSNKIKDNRKNISPSLDSPLLSFASVPQHPATFSPMDPYQNSPIPTSPTPPLPFSAPSSSTNTEKKYTLKPAVTRGAASQHKGPTSALKSFNPSKQRKK